MTSSASIIYHALLEKYPEALQEITALSRNTKDRKDFVICDVAAFNFDLVKTLAHEKEKSPDALFLDGDTLHFVEFKEGEGTNVKKTDIRQKIHEAIITLFQFATSNKLLNRDLFLDMPIKYAVVMRSKANGSPSPSFLNQLKETEEYFSLKNMEGLLLREAKVLIKGEAIFKLLAKISDGAINRIELVPLDQSGAAVFTHP
jgi:hypothetical protein